MFNCPAEDESSDETKLRKLRVIALVRKHEQPHLWSAVSDHILEDGELDLSLIQLSIANLDDLRYLFSEVTTRKISKLK